jgi:hypothetical protein
LFWLWGGAGKDLIQGAHDDAQVFGAPFPHQQSQSVTQGRRDRTEGVEHSVLIRCASQHDQLTLPSSLLPLIKLIEPVRPMTATTEQTHNNQFGLSTGDAEVVIHLSGMLQAR